MMVPLHGRGRPCGRQVTVHAGTRRSLRQVGAGASPTCVWAPVEQGCGPRTSEEAAPPTARCLSAPIVRLGRVAPSASSEPCGMRYCGRLITRSEARKLQLACIRFPPWLSPNFNLFHVPGHYRNQAESIARSKDLQAQKRSVGLWDACVLGSQRILHPPSSGPGLRGYAMLLKSSAENMIEIEIGATW